MVNVTQLKTKSTSEHRAITHRTAGSLLPRQRAYFIRDINHQGFAIKVNPSGSSVWLTDSRVRGAGKTCRITHGPTSSISYKKALQLHLNTMEKLATGVDVSEERRIQRAQALSWSDILERYIADKTAAGKLRESTVRLYNNLMKNPLAPLSDRSITDTGKHRVKQWYLKLNEHPAQANQCLRLLRSLYNYANALEMIPDNLIDPTLAITKTGLKYDDPVKEKQLMPEQLGEFVALTLYMADVEDAFCQTTRDSILMLIATGLRKENVLGMRWENVDLDKQELTLPLTKTTQQLVPLTSLTCDLLRSRKAGSKSPWVFPSVRTNKKHFANPIYALSRISKRMKLDWDLTPNMLRKSFASLLGRLDTQQHYVKALIGHSLKTDVTLKHYQQMHMVPLRAAAQRAHDFISQEMPLDALISTDRDITATTASLRILAFGAEVTEGLDADDAFDIVPPEEEREYAQLNSRPR
jgi:integrase